MHSHWCRVTDSLSELTSDLVLRREVDLLEQLWGDGQAARGADLPQRIIGIVVVVEMVVCIKLSAGILAWDTTQERTVREILLEWCVPHVVMVASHTLTMMFCGHLERLCRAVDGWIVL